MNAPFGLGSWAVLQELQGHPGLWLYMARHCSTEQVALLKVLPPEAVRDCSVRAQFLFEARLAAANPDRLLQAYEVFAWGSSLVAVMEWPRGEVLSKFSRPLDGPLAVAVCLDVAHALTTMHRSEVINGAVRSDAVLVAPGVESWRPTAKLLDLGFCLQSGRVKTGANGTGSLAPENAHGAPVDAKSDIYGLGALGFELLTGRTWHMGAGDALPEDTPERFGVLLNRCLAADPLDRPASMRLVAEELEWTRYELAWGSFGTASAGGAAGDAHFGEHAGWFIEDGDELGEDQLVSLVGYARSRSAFSSVLSWFAVALVAGTVIFAGLVLGLSGHGG